ncbi:MAG TPA: glutamine synthetase family protein [Myxococcota bacterium]|nr:glutamine synthetase family protein [Myxococcota bacterium]
MAKPGVKKAAEVPGLLSRAQLEEAIHSGEVETVVTVVPDMYGRLVGKRITGRFFLDETAEHGMHVCDYLLACDMEMDPTPGYAFTSWEKGYGDVLCKVDWPTLRRATWLEKSAIVVCDVFKEDSEEPVSVAPRNVLRRQMERARELGYVALGASELEFFAFRESYESAHAKGYDKLATFGQYVEDYHILQGTKTEALNGAIRRHLDASGVPVEFSKGEWGPGQQEINLRYCELVEMADRHVIYKNACKEIAASLGLAITFMAKWDAQMAGNSMHVHTSLWDPELRTNLFAGDEALPGSPLRSATLFRHWLAGLLVHAREIALFLAPTVNSYKRFVEGTFAPTAIGWAVDNRTAGFRVVGHGAGLRSECRIPGADANPYLAFAALLAAGLDGIERKLEPPPMFVGNLYTAVGLPQVPRTLGEAIGTAEGSAFLRQAFGDDVVEHYLHFARVEKRKFDSAVTTWERARYFERI